MEGWVLHHLATHCRPAGVRGCGTALACLLPTAWQVRQDVSNAGEATAPWQQTHLLSTCQDEYTSMQGDCCRSHSMTTFYIAHRSQVQNAASVAWTLMVQLSLYMGHSPLCTTSTQASISTAMHSCTQTTLSRQSNNM